MNVDNAEMIQWIHTRRPLNLYEVLSRAQVNNHVKVSQWAQAEMDKPQPQIRIEIEAEQIPIGTDVNNSSFKKNCSFR